MQFTLSKSVLDDYFPVIVRELLEDILQRGFPANVAGRYVESLMTNCQGGKLYRSLIVPEMGRLLLDRSLTGHEQQDVMTLAWLVEIWQGYLLVVDDALDGTTERRGRASWHVRPHVGMMFANEAILLKSAALSLLKKHFEGHPSYSGMMACFQEVSYQVELAQEWDALSTQQEKPESWSIEYYERLIAIKGGYGSFILPVQLTLHYLNIATPGNIKQATEVTLLAGMLYQLRNDYSDISSEKVEKTGFSLDIKEGKCTWVIVSALSMCSDEDRTFLSQNYGTKDDNIARKIQSIFDTLSLTSLFDSKEAEMVETLTRAVEQVDESEGLKKAIFYHLFEMRYT